MAAGHSQASTRQASAQRSTVPATPKLRDSCLACATSKLKCNKEKPTCARCTKRGLTCEYCVTKRAGRKHRNAAKEALASPAMSSSTSSEITTTTSPNLVETSLWQYTSSCEDTLPSLLSPADSTSFWTLTDLDTFFAPLPPPETETVNLDAETLAQSHIYPGGINNGLLDSNGATPLLIPEEEFAVTDNEVSKLSTLSKICSLSNSGCLTRALELLGQLFSCPSTTYPCARGKSYMHATYQRPTTQCVIAKNKQTIEAISDMLQCPCSQDDYLFAIMSLITLKVLGWYAAAAHETPMMDGSQSPTYSHYNDHRHSFYHSEQVLQISKAIGSYHSSGEDQGRITSQLILSELHRVQRLVNLLSQQLHCREMRDEAVSTSRSAADGQDILSGGKSRSPFSTTTLNQFDADLRNRLRALSLEIVDNLRQG